MASTPGPGERSGASSSVAGLLRNPAFLAIWWVGTATSTVRWLEMLAVGVFVFDLTGSPFLVALMTILRMLPLALFGAFAGAVVERFDRRRVMIVTQALMVVVTFALGMLAHIGQIEVWHLGLGAFISGIFWVTDFPVRRTILADVVGPVRIGTAMSLDTLTNNGTRMLGPLLGGLLLEALGLDGTFFIGATGYALGLLSVMWIPTAEPQAGGGPLRVFARVVEGLRYLRADRRLTAILMVTIVFNLWGFPFVAMVPVIGKGVLELSAFPIGVLASAEGAGALCGALVLIVTARIPYYRRIYFGGVVLYLGMAIAFSQSTLPWLSGVLLFATGLGGAAFASMQSTLVLLNTPAEVRSRMMGVLSVCIGTGPIGFLHLGMLADWLGAPTAVALIGIEGLAASFVVYRLWPEAYALQDMPR